MSATRADARKFQTPEIPAEFTIRLRDKDYITANGLIYLAHLQGLKRVCVEHLKLPTPQDPSAIVRCEVETDLGTFADYGEVSPASKGSVGGAYPLSLATTRARNRALRIATGCPLTSYEEMGADEDAGGVSVPTHPARSAEDVTALKAALLGEYERLAAEWQRLDPSVEVPAMGKTVKEVRQQIAEMQAAVDALRQEQPF